MSTTTESSFERDEAVLEEKGLLSSQLEYELEPKKRAPLSWFWIVILAISVSMNVLSLAFTVFKPTTIAYENVISKYAKLKHDNPLPFASTNQDNTLTEDEWNAYNVDLGNVALSDTYAQSMGLPLAQRWPWDFSKGIYYLHGHHQMHCLQMLRKTINEYRAGKLQTEHPTHVDHCLIAIREDIVCNADDTPRFTGGHFKHPSSGTGQTRACRDWKKLDEWAKQHSACYREPDDPYDGTSELERYKSCPDGSTPWVEAELWEMENSEEKGGLWLERET